MQTRCGGLDKAALRESKWTKSDRKAPQRAITTKLAPTCLWLTMPAQWLLLLEYAHRSTTRAQTGWQLLIFSSELKPTLVMCRTSMAMMWFNSKALAPTSLLLHEDHRTVRSCSWLQQSTLDHVIANSINYLFDPLASVARVEYTSR